MKKFLLSVLLAAGCVALHAETPMVRQTRFEGRNITGVVAGSSFNVEVYQSDTTRAIVEIPAELQEFLIFQIDGQGVVTLGLDYSWKKKNNVLNEIMRSLRSNGAQMKAKIYITGLRVLKASSSARIRPMTPLTGNSAELGISSSGRIENLKLNATGRVRLALSSSGRLTNAEIAAQDLDCTLSSSSSASLTHHGKSATFGQSSSSRIDISGEVGSANIITSSSASFRGQPLSPETPPRDAGQLLFVADYRRCRSGSQSHRKQLFGHLLQRRPENAAGIDLLFGKDSQRRINLSLQMLREQRTGQCSPTGNTSKASAVGR